MISFFPSPYPDELWYSVICRYHVHSGNYCAKHTLRQLYGDNFCAPSLMLCGPIKALLAQLPQGFLSARDVVMQHTFFPYYARFFPTQRKRSSYAYVVNGNPLAVHRMGISQANGNPSCAIVPSVIKRICNYMVSLIGIAATNCRICRFAPSTVAGWSIPMSHTTAHGSRSYSLQHLLCSLKSSLQNPCRIAYRH